jgi:RNA polymerase sigma-70 factor (ECF subfamily)
MEELQTAEIASILSLQQGTVRVRLHRARLFVRRELAGVASQRSPHRSRSAMAPAPLRGIRSCKELLAALSEYLDGAADESVRRRLEKHLDQCPPCKSFLKDLQRTIQQCKDCPSPRMAPEVAARLRSKLREECRNYRLSSELAPVR